MTDTTLTVLLIDDHRMFVESMDRLLRAEPDITVVGMATTAEEGLALATRNKPSVVLMDFHLPDHDGVSTARRLTLASPGSRVVLVTGLGGSDVLAAAVEAGCVGYLEKGRGVAELARAVRLAAAGGIVLPDGALRTLLPQLLERRGRSAESMDLTPREDRVLNLMARGSTNENLARDLGLSLNTVRNHVQTLLNKLGAHSKLEAVVNARQRGLLDDEVFGS